MKRSIVILAVFAGLVVLAPAAVAGEDTTDTTAPTTETPVTETPVTEVPTTTTVTDVPATTTDVPTTTVTETPTTTIPTTGTEAPCLTDCIPETEECVGADCIPAAGGAFPTPTVGAGALPFTGIEDMVAPILLALTVVLGGVVAWRWARLREAVAEAATRARPLPAREARSGYAAALRQQVIEQRARQMFTPRVA